MWAKSGIADGDTVDYSNLQRQILHGREDVGREKTESAVETVSRLNPDVRLRPYKTISAENILEVIAPYNF